MVTLSLILIHMQLYLPVMSICIILMQVFTFGFYIYQKKQLGKKLKPDQPKNIFQGWISYLSYFVINLTLLMFGITGFILTRFSRGKNSQDSVKESNNLVQLGAGFSLFIAGLVLMSILIEVIKSIVSLVNLFRNRKLRSILARSRPKNGVQIQGESERPFPVDREFEGLDTVRMPKKFNPTDKLDIIEDEDTPRSGFQMKKLSKKKADKNKIRIRKKRAQMVNKLKFGKKKKRLQELGNKSNMKTPIITKFGWRKNISGKKHAFKMKITKPKKSRSNSSTNSVNRNLKMTKLGKKGLKNYLKSPNKMSSGSKKPKFTNLLSNDSLKSKQSGNNLNILNSKNPRSSISARCILQKPNTRSGVSIFSKIDPSVFKNASSRRVNISRNDGSN